MFWLPFSCLSVRLAGSVTAARRAKLASLACDAGSIEMDPPATTIIGTHSKAIRRNIGTPLIGSEMYWIGRRDLPFRDSRLSLAFSYANCTRCYAASIKMMRLRLPVSPSG